MYKSIIILSMIIIMGYSQTQRIEQDCSLQNSYWNTQICVYCQPGCSCSSPYGCDELVCGSNQVVQEQESGYKSCVNCPTGCAVCELKDGKNNFKCTECVKCSETEPNCGKSEYQLIKGICVLLTQTSINFSSNTYDVFSSNTQKTKQPYASCSEYDPKSSLCIQCPDSYFLNEYNSCEPCPTACGVCNARGTCSSCKQGFYWSPNGQSDTAFSQLSQQGYPQGNYVDSAGLCNACQDPGATACDSTGLVSQECHVRFYLDTNQTPNKCKVCMDNCLTCSSATVCTQCQTGYYFAGGKCELCYDNSSATSIKCSNCETGKNTKCDECASGYQWLLNHCEKCSAKVSNCQLCVDTNETITCATCYNGFYLTVESNGTTTCSPCSKYDSNAKYCYKDDNGANENVVITQCNTGYSLVKVKGSETLKCTANQNDCLLMVDSEGKCETCLPGQTNFNQVCKSCSATIPGCLECVVKDNQLGCSSCQSGDRSVSSSNYALNTSSNKCDLCSNTLCSKCNANGTCNECKYGAVLVSNDCKQCTANYCLVCESSNLATCTTCLQGYFLSTNTEKKTTTCLACPSGCSECQSQGQTCAKCLSGYYLKDGGCNLGNPYCSTYESDGSCSSCQYAFRLQEGRCFPCLDFVSGYVCGESSNGSMILNILVLLIVIVLQ